MCTRAIYKYKFSFISEKEKYKETKEFKMSVGFYVPDWAKGAVMYQIFIDRFYRDTSVKIEEFGKRKIHKNWNDAPILGPDEMGNGIQIPLEEISMELRKNWIISNR